MAQQQIKLLADNGAKEMRVLEALTPINNSTAPAVNAKYIGQIYVKEHATTPEIYIAVKVGDATPANDWKKVTIS